MKNFKTFAAFLFVFALTLSCEEAVSETTDELKTENTDDVESSGDTPEETIQEEEDVPQTVDERIKEIKELYAQIQSSPNQNKDCTSKAKTTINYDVIEEGIPFENTAKECILENDLKFQQVVLNGYEWSETVSFYFKDDQRFFSYVSGGAEAYGYDYRVYYDKDGEVIRVLLAENDYDGQEVSAPFEITEEGRKKEILNAVAYAKKELDKLLSEK
ncbi:MAG: hypothetical protein P8P74_08025 [Crocinitomicaceae bacterium]|nr:hypothetical protein [Crocinitomicaceae bacterium]